MQETTIFMQVSLVLAQILSFYNLLIWIRILLSWFGSMSHINQSAILIYLKKIVDPYLNLFRNVKILKTQNIDFTPLLAFALLSIIQSILTLFGTTGEISLYIIVALILNTLWSYLLSPFFFIFTAIIIIRLVLCYKRSPNTINFIRSLERIIGGYLNWVQKVFFFGKIISDRILLIVSTAVTILFYLLTRTIITYIITYLLSL